MLSNSPKAGRHRAPERGFSLSSLRCVPQSASLAVWGCSSHQYAHCGEYRQAAGAAAESLKPQSLAPLLYVINKKDNPEDAQDHSDGECGSPAAISSAILTSKPLFFRV